jgi:endonuclease/exonuclease/phosphatase family metal-dependent hydrolase
LDTTIQGIFWTNNLGAGQDPIAILIQILLTGLALTLIILGQVRNEEEQIDRSWSGVVLLVSIGPYFLLQLLIFQNQGYISEVIGIGLPQAFVVITFGNLASIIGLYVGNLKPSTPSFIGVIAAIFLGVSILLMEHSHPLIPLVLILAQFIFGWGFSRIAMQGSLANINHLIRTSVVIGFSQILFVSLLLISFGNLALTVELPSGAVMGILAILMGGIVLLADRMSKGLDLQSTKNPSLILITAVLFLTSIVHSVIQISKTGPEVTPSLPVRVMTYNIHSAVSNIHGQDLEAIAQVIERSGSDIIAIQEISRGWLISGGIDMVSWLSSRLGMEAIFAGTADTLWGNSILSRYPIVESGSGPLPMLDSKIPRGYIWAKIDVGETSPLLIINSHLQNGSEEQHVRLAQVPVLLNVWGNSTSSILLGDLNATPGAEELNMIMNSGLIDSWEEGSTGRGDTVPAHQPSIRLDWIWHTRDLVAIEAQVISTTSSDHLPVIALIDVVSH